MRRRWLAVLLTLPLAACGTVGGSAPAPAAANATQAGYFVVPAAQLAHVQVVPVARATWTTTLHTTATVDWDNDHTTQAITQVSGPVTRLAVDTGAEVKVGDPLLYVASPDMAGAIAAYRKAKNRMDLAQRTLDRSRDLLEHQAIAQRDMEEVQADYNDAATDVQTALQSLKIFDVAESDLDDAERQNQPIRPELAMRSPIAGTVVQRLVLPGQVIQAGATVAFVVSNMSTVWVQGHIYEQDLAHVHVGDAVDARSAAVAGTFHGTVAYIDRLLDPATRTTLVRIVTPNDGAALKKDMFVDVDIHDRDHRDVLTCPVASVLYDDQNMPFVYVQVQPGTFAQRPVTLGVQQGDQVEIRQGLTEADRVVAQGSLFLQFANSVNR